MRNYQQELDDLGLFEPDSLLRMAVEEIIVGAMERVREEQIQIIAREATTVDPYGTFEDSVDTDSILNCTRARLRYPMATKKDTETTFYCTSKVDKYDEYGQLCFVVGSIVQEKLSESQYEVEKKKDKVVIIDYMGGEHTSHCEFTQDEITWWQQDKHIIIEQFRLNPAQTDEERK